MNDETRKQPSIAGIYTCIDDLVECATYNGQTDEFGGDAAAEVRVREARERLEKAIEMLWVKYEPLNEGDEVVFVGCYVTRWGKDVEPTVGFRRLGALKAGDE